MGAAIIVPATIAGVSGPYLSPVKPHKYHKTSLHLSVGCIYLSFMVPLRHLHVSTTADILTRVPKLFRKWTASDVI